MNMQMNKMKILATIAFSLMMLLPTFSTHVQMVQAQEVPREETVYTMQTMAPQQGWNPLLPSYSWGVSMMYCPLFLYSVRDNSWIPWLAEGYRWIDEYTFEIKIRAGAKWDDGVPVTASDVKYTLELGKKYVLGWSSFWIYFDEVKVVDDKTVQFVTSEDKVNYFMLLSALNYIILPKHRFEVLEEELGADVTSFPDNEPEKIVANGPYELYMWEEELWYYKRVEDWWGKDVFGLPVPKYIAQRSFRSVEACSMSFEKGEIDYGTHFLSAIYEMWEVKKLPVRTYFAHRPYFLQSGPIGLSITYAKYPLNNTIVRRAIAYALPYDDLISKAYFNYSVPASPSLIQHLLPAYAKYIDETLVEKYSFEYNITEAKRILDEADIIDRDGDGVREMPDGTKLGPFKIQNPFGYTDYATMCEMVAPLLREIGIDVEVKLMDESVWWNEVMTGEFDMQIMWDAGADYSHPWNTFRYEMDPRLTGPVGEVRPEGNYERYINWDVVPLLDAVPKEKDEEKLKALYSELQEIAMRDLPFIPVCYGAQWYQYSEVQWVGWPREEDPRWGGGGWTPNVVPTYFGIALKGETPVMPAWVTDLQFPTSKIFEDLAEAPIHIVTVTETLTETVETTVKETVTRTTTTTTTEAAETVTETETETEAITETTTSTVSVPTMDITSVAGAGIVALIIGVIVGWLVGKK